MTDPVTMSEEELTTELESTERNTEEARNNVACRFFQFFFFALFGRYIL